MDYSVIGSSGALGKSYCVYFNLISLIGIFFMIFIALTVIYELATKSKSPEYYFAAFMGFITYFFIYLQNKLLYDMCRNSLQ